MNITNQTDRRMDHRLDLRSTTMLHPVGVDEKAKPLLYSTLNISLGGMLLMGQDRQVDQRVGVCLAIRGTREICWLQGNILRSTPGAQSENSLVVIKLHEIPDNYRKIVRELVQRDVEAWF